MGACIGVRGWESKRGWEIGTCAGIQDFGFGELKDLGGGKEGEG